MNTFTTHGLNAAAASDVRRAYEELAGKSAARLTRGPSQSRVSAREEGEDFANGGFLAGGSGHREVCLDLVTVATAVFCFTT